MGLHTASILTAAIVMLTSPLTAAPPPPPPSPLDAVAAVAPADAAAAAEVTASGPGLTVRSGGLEQSVSTDPLDGITVDAEGHRVGITLPFAARADVGESESAGTMSFDNNNGTSSVSLIREDGAVQVATVIADASAPTRFEYPITLPPGARLIADGAGAVIVDAEGASIGSFQAPWARDADGRPVPTRYDVHGATLTQIVDHRGSFTYPVVADPTYVTSTFYWSKAQVREMYKGVQNVNNICRWVPLPYLAGVGCGAVPAFESAITKAYYQHKRVKAVYYNCGYTYCGYYRYYVVA